MLTQIFKFVKQAICAVLLVFYGCFNGVNVIPYCKQLMVQDTNTYIEIGDLGIYLGKKGIESFFVK